MQFFHIDKIKVMKYNETVMVKNKFIYVQKGYFMADLEKKSIDNEEEYEPEIVDLDGESFEVIDALEVDGVNYVALVPYVEDIDDETDETEFIILKEVEENGEFYLATIDDDELYSKIGEQFMNHFDELFELDDDSE